MSQRHLLSEQLADYVGAVQGLDLERLQEAVDLLMQVQARGGTVYVCGNGGSASAASHFATDLMKTAASAGNRALRAIALGDNPALLTALANDTSYDRVFAEPLRSLARPGDLLVVITGSGNSPNVVAALRESRALGIASFAFTGFAGGEAMALADAALHVPSDHYGVVEAAHSAAMHLITFALRDTLASATGQAAR